jgi:hypothetical protein
MASTRKRSPGRRKTGVPMSLRLPAALRQRVRRFAKARGLEEATAVRTLCAERLNELDLTEDLMVAERWQLDRALESWDKLERGELELVEPDEIRRVFAEARARSR